MAEWNDLSRELDAWCAENRRATFWWRDDDAVCQTAALERLLDTSHETQTPVAVAVIPGEMDTELVGYLDNREDIEVLQHGFKHINHAPPPSKASEFGPERDPQTRLNELSKGRKLLSKFRRLLPVLVPPWNRIDESLLRFLPEIGISGISTFAPRAADEVPGLTRVNTHVDIVNWRHGRKFLGIADTLECVVDHLRARRAGSADPDEATGLLTHHLVHDEQGWAFLVEFLSLTGAHSGARWVKAEEAFGF